MMRLCGPSFGLTLDWIYRGAVAGIEPKLLAKLQNSLKANPTGSAPDQSRPME
jgi:hypothetical protein